MPETRKRPAGNRPSPKSTAADILDGSPDRRHSTPTADERREAELLAELRNLGYTISVRCTVCNHPLTTDLSTALHVGPKCRAKAVADV